MIGAVSRIGYMTRNELLSIYSDVFKERNGFRPRNYGWMTDAELTAAIEALEALPPIEWEPYDYESGEVDHVTPAQPTAGDGWAFIPA